MKDVKMHFKELKINKLMNENNIKDFIKSRCEVSETPNHFGSHEIRMDGCYVGIMELVETGQCVNLNLIMKLGLTKVFSTSNNVANYGFSESENKWYGWSHRAYHGFTIGSTCKKGNIHYYPSNKEDYINNMIDFWMDEDYYEIQPHIKENDLTNTDERVTLHYKNKDFVDKGVWATKVITLPTEYGKGEWVAESLDDAKQMAIDFANKIS